MNDRLALKAIKDTLQNSLEDPRFQYTRETRKWIHTDTPLDTATFPRIQVKKRGPTTTEIRSEGMNFLEQKIMTIDVQFWIEGKFKWKDETSSYLMEDELVKEYLEKIWQTLKDAQPVLQEDFGISGLKNLYEGDPYYEEDTQLFTGIISVRIWYFRR